MPENQTILFVWPNKHLYRGQESETSLYEGQFQSKALMFIKLLNAEWKMFITKYNISKVWATHEII